MTIKASYADPGCVWGQSEFIFFLRFKKSRVIAPLHTGGPVALSSDGTRLFTCVDTEAHMTDASDGREMCGFEGVGFSGFQVQCLCTLHNNLGFDINHFHGYSSVIDTSCNLLHVLILTRL